MNRSNHTTSACRAEINHVVELSAASNGLLREPLHLRSASWDEPLSRYLPVCVLHTFHDRAKVIAWKLGKKQTATFSIPFPTRTALSVQKSLQAAETSSGRMVAHGDGQRFLRADQDHQFLAAADGRVQ